MSGPREQDRASLTVQRGTWPLGTSCLLYEMLLPSHMLMQRLSRLSGQKLRKLKRVTIKYDSFTVLMATLILQKQRPSFLHLRLRHSITAQDDSSEKVANAFIEGRPINGLSTPSMRTDSPAPGSESAGYSASSFSGVSPRLPRYPDQS